MNIFQKLVANWNTAVSAPYPRRTNPRKKTKARVARNPPDIAIYDSRLRPAGSALGPLPAPSRPDEDSSFPGPGGGCCADLESMTLVCADASDPRAGATIVEVAETNVVDGVAVVTVGFVDAGGRRNGRFPLCDEVPYNSGFEPGPNNAGCCFDAETMSIFGCTDSSNLLHGATVMNIVSIDTEGGTAMIVVLLPNGETQTLSLPLCDVPDDVPEDVPEDECCFDQAMGRLVCGDNIPPNPLHMAEATVEAVHDNGTATVYVNGDPSMGMRVPLCPQLGCCLDLSTGTLICVDEFNASYNGLQVSVLEVGQLFARVSHSALPGGTAYVPLCPSEDPGDCCYNQDTGLIECTDPSNPLHGLPAGILTDPGPEPSGIHFVELSSSAGQFRLPLCGGGECPPLYCCVNRDTGAFVCPGIPELNGQAADVSDFVEDGGYQWAVLSNGQMVPVCGRGCPPPVVCADGLWMTPTGECGLPTDVPGTCPPCPDFEPGSCPTCPPGYLLDTNTGECILPPSCPTCPPGYLLDTNTGQCVQCPGDTPGDIPWLPPGDPGDGECCPSDGQRFWRPSPCCGSCAEGGACEGGDDHGHGLEGNPIGGIKASQGPTGWKLVNSLNGGKHYAPPFHPPQLGSSSIWLWIRGADEKWNWTPMKLNEMLEKFPSLQAELGALTCSHGTNPRRVAVATVNHKGWPVSAKAYCIYGSDDKPMPKPGVATRLARAGS